MGLFSKKNKLTTTKCLVIGEDRKLTHRDMEATGVFFVDNTNRLAYDSLPEAIGVYKNGARYLGQISLLYEAMARPFSFKDLGWAKVEHKTDVILDSALSEGCSKGIQSIEQKDRFDKMSTILLLLSAGVIGMALLFALQSGVFSRLLGG